MDIYSTGYLARVVEQLVPLPTFFLDTFFPQVVTETTEEIYFDQVQGKPRIAPFVHPMREGKLVQDLGYSTKSFKPAYVKDKRVHVPTKALKRKAGEAIMGSLTPAQRLQLRLVEDIQDQRDMLTRRLEVMAAEAIMYGRQTVAGDGFPTVVVDFQRDNALTVTLTSTAKWDDVGNTTQSNSFEDWSQLLLTKGGAGDGIIVMDVKAWKLLKRDTGFLKTLDDKFKKSGDGSKVDLAPRFRAEGVQYKGNIGDFELYVYSHTYVNDAGATVNIMPDNTVIMASRTRVEGVRHFGAIQDLDAGLQSMEQFVKSWVVPDPSARFLLSQSAPLMVPYRPNATLIATVA